MLTLKKIFLRGRVMAEFFNLGLAPKVRLPSDSENDRESLNGGDFENCAKTDADRKWKV